MPQASPTPLDFSSIVSTTSKTLNTQIEALVEAIFQSVWQQVADILSQTEEYQGVMEKITEERKEDIKNRVKGMSGWENTQSDRLYGIQATIETCKIMILQELWLEIVKEITSQFDSQKDFLSPWEAIILSKSMVDKVRKLKLIFGISS